MDDLADCFSRCVVRNNLIDRTRVQLSNDFNHEHACTISINYHVKSMHGYYSVFTNMLDKALCRNKIIINIKVM